MTATVADPTEETKVTVDEVFAKHQDLLIALMDRVPRPAPGVLPATEDFTSIIKVLEIYANEITDLDLIVWQPYVATRSYPNTAAMKLAELIGGSNR